MDYASLAGKTYPPFTAQVTADQVSAYAEAIGDGDPLRHDIDAARAAGYRGLVAPPTFGFALALQAGQCELPARDIGSTVNESLHGEQGFTHHAPICSGDVVTGRQWIVEAGEKKGGALRFVTVRFELRLDDGTLAVEMSQTSLVRRAGS